MSGLKKLVGQTALYGVSSIAGRMLNYLLVPFYTAVFAAERYGIVTEIYAYVAFLNVLYAFGMETAYFRNAAGKLDNEKHVYSLALSTILVLSGVLTVTLVLCSSSIVNALHYEGHEEYVIYMALTMAIDAVATIPFAKLRLENRAKRFVAIRMLGIVLNVFFNIFFLYVLRKIASGELLPGLQGSVGSLYSRGDEVGYVFLSNLLANAVMLVLLAPELVKAKFIWLWAEVKPLLVYSFPRVLMGLSGMVNEMLSRTILKEYLPLGFYKGVSNEAALGIFGAVYKLSIFMQLAIQAFRYSAEPFFFSKAADKAAPELFARVMKWFVIICTAMFLFISLNLYWIGPLFLKRKEYLTGLEVVPVLLLANLFLGMYYNFSAWFKIADKTYYGSYISGGGAVVTILLNLILIPSMGYMGSATATLICYAGMAMVCYVLGQKYYPIPYPIVTLGLYLLGAIMLLSLNVFDKAFAFHLGYWARVVWDSILFMIFLVIVTFVERKEWKVILGSRFARK
jgi:O-antigen/teichoic acid export membrane protein